MGAFLAALAIYIGLAWPATVVGLPLLAPPALFFIQIARGGDTQWVRRLWLACVFFLLAAYLLDSDRCLDAGGAYSGWFGPCSGAAPSHGLIFEGRGSVGAWVISVIAALIGSAALEVGARKIWSRTRAV